MLALRRSCRRVIPQWRDGLSHRARAEALAAADEGVHRCARGGRAPLWKIPDFLNFLIEMAPAAH